MDGCTHVSSKTLNVEVVLLLHRSSTVVLPVQRIKHCMRPICFPTWLRQTTITSKCLISWKQWKECRSPNQHQTSTGFGIWSRTAKQRQRNSYSRRWLMAYVKTTFHCISHSLSGEQEYYWNEFVSLPNNNTPPNESAGRFQAITARASYEFWAAALIHMRVQTNAMESASRFCFRLPLVIFT